MVPFLRLRPLILALPLKPLPLPGSSPLVFLAGRVEPPSCSYLTLQSLSSQGAHLAVIDALMVVFAFEWTKTLPGPLALASLEHKLLFWVDTVGGVVPPWAGSQDHPVTGTLTSPGPPDHPAAAGEDGAGSSTESISLSPCRWGGTSTALGEAKAMDGGKDR